MQFQWKEIEPNQLMDSKLRCVFEMPVETTFKQSPSNAKSDGSTGGDLNAALTSSSSSSQSQQQQASGDVNQVKSSDVGSNDPMQIGTEVKQLRDESLKLRMEKVALQVSRQRPRRD